MLSHHLLQQLHFDVRQLQRLIISICLNEAVEVVRGGAVVKTFATDTSTVIGGVIRPGAVERFDRMVNTLAQRIIDGT